MIKRWSQTYFGHVNKPSTEVSASHRHYFGFPNYVLTYLQHADNTVSLEAETTKTAVDLHGGIYGEPENDGFHKQTDRAKVNVSMSDINV